MSPKQSKFMEQLEFMPNHSAAAAYSGLVFEAHSRKIVFSEHSSNVEDANNKFALRKTVDTR